MPHSSRTLRLGTRKSLLAMTQSTWVKDTLEAIVPDLSVELVQIITKGDRIQDVALAKVGGKGLFVKEIEEALLRSEVDFAVHSLKDVPAEVPDGLEVSVFPRREDPRDALISRDGRKLSELDVNAVIGTSSLRRSAQLSILRHDIIAQNLRGNLDTRLKRLEHGDFDAILLATAGLNRLGMASRVTEHLDVRSFVPAVGQGVLGIEFRSDDTETASVLKHIHHEETAICAMAERGFLARLGGGCQVPLGAFAQIDNGILKIHGIICSPDTKKTVRHELKGRPEDAQTLGIELAEIMLSMGGKQILEALYDLPA